LFELNISKRDGDWVRRNPTWTKASKGNNKRVEPERRSTLNGMVVEEKRDLKVNRKGKWGILIMTRGGDVQRVAVRGGEETLVTSRARGKKRKFEVQGEAGK